jgi:NADPH2:quinone reductase
MKAIVCKTYGPPENLVLEEIDDPVAAENEAVVQI